LTSLCLAIFEVWWGNSRNLMRVLVDGLLDLQKEPCLVGPSVDTLTLSASNTKYIWPATNKIQQLTRNKCECYSSTGHLRFVQTELFQRNVMWKEHRPLKGFSWAPKQTRHCIATPIVWPPPQWLSRVVTSSPRVTCSAANGLYLNNPHNLFSHLHLVIRANRFNTGTK
jgi:hypothetical protein